MGQGGLSERYARALYELDLAASGMTLSQVQRELSLFAQLYMECSDLKHLFENPSFSVEERKAVVNEVVTNKKLSKTTKHFLFLMCDNGRTRLLPEVAEHLQRFVDRDAGIVQASVTSAGQLDDKQEKALTEVLAEMRGAPVKVSIQVDSELIGGVVVTMEGKVYDGSVEKQLESIREAILRETR
jgi:F-type H+-transporting ATPase subunit delta